VELSTDNIEWTTVVVSTLQDARGIVDCTEVEVEQFCFSQMEARYIKFTVKSHYGNGGGLNYINWSNGNPFNYVEKTII
jgi:hypothetical protein